MIFGTTGKSVGVALLLLSIHYVSIHIYSYWCVPLSVYGLIESIFTVASPPCTLLLSISSKSQELYTASWVAMGVAAVSLIGRLWGGKNG